MSVTVSSHLNYTPIYTESQVRESVVVLLIIFAGGRHRGRTYNLRFRRPTLYPVEASRPQNYYMII